MFDLSEVSYIQKGTGEDLVFFHGYLASKESFAAQIEYFSRFYRVTAFDFLGFGASAPLTEPFSGTPAARLVRYSDYTTLLCLRQCIIGLDHLKIFFPNLAHAEQIQGAFVRHGDAFCIGRHIAGGFLPPGREVRGHNGA